MLPGFNRCPSSGGWVRSAPASKKQARELRLENEKLKQDVDKMKEDLDRLKDIVGSLLEKHSEE